MDDFDLDWKPRPQGKIDGFINRGTSEEWTCRDGRIINIQDMDNDHLINTVQYLLRCRVTRIDPKTGEEYKEKVDVEFLEQYIPQWNRLLLELRERRIKIEETEK